MSPAAELGTTRLNIVTFMKVFFDVRRYLGNDVWLRRIVTAPPEGMGEAEALRERRWLTAAYHRGWEGVEQVIFRRVPATTEAIERMNKELTAALGSRALEYVGDLQASDQAPTEADLRRFFAARNIEARQPPRETGKDNVMDVFVAGLHGTLLEMAKETGDPELTMLLPAKDGGPAAHEPPQRLRRRLAGV